MKSRRHVIGAAIGIGAMGMAGAAQACANLNEAMAHFETVKNAYVAKAPQMTPEMFPVWTAHLENFGQRMGAQDYAGACAALDQASLDLGFTSEAAAPAAPAAAETAPAAPAAAETAPLATVEDSSQGSQNEQPASNPQPAAQVADGSGWKECPRGRCWSR